MKRCGYCGQQNEEAATHCIECGTEFPVIEAADPQLADPSTELVIVGTFGDTAEASVLKGRLEQAGIEACIPEELDPSPFGSFAPLAHVTVRVAKKDFEAAREVLTTPAGDTAS